MVTQGWHIPKELLCFWGNSDGTRPKDKQKPRQTPKQLLEDLFHSSLSDQSKAEGLCQVFGGFLQPSEIFLLRGLGELQGRNEVNFNQEATGSLLSPELPLADNPFL